MTVRDPSTPVEWHVAVDAAEGSLLLDSARKYGLVTGGPAVDVERCVAILDRGRAVGIHPTEAGVDGFVDALVVAYGRRGAPSRSDGGKP